MGMAIWSPRGRLRTVADGCERKRNVKRTHPQPPDPQSETGTLATHSGKRSSPLVFIFDSCTSTSLSHCFNVGEAEHIYLYPFAGTHVSSAEKHMFCNLGARWHIIFEFVPDD